MLNYFYLLEREDYWDVNQNWEDILSLGEQQRLGMVSSLVTLLDKNFDQTKWYLTSKVLNLYEAK